MSSLSRKALIVKGSVMTYLQPKLAADARVNLDEVLDDVDNDNYKDKIHALLWRITDAIKGKLAGGASISDLKQLLEALKQVGEPEIEGNASDEPNTRRSREVERLTAEDRRPGSDEGFHNRFPAGRRIGVV